MQREDFGLEDVAAGDDEVGRRVLLLGLFDHGGDGKALVRALAAGDDAVGRDLLHRHFLDGDDVAAGLLIGFHHLLEDAGRGLEQHVGQQQREGLVADQLARAPDGVAEAERLLLAGEAGLAGLRQIALRARRGRPICRAASSVCSSSYCLSKWSSMTDLLRPVTKTKCSMPASRASSTAYWISGRSTTVSISLGIALVAGRKRVPRPATGNTAVRTRLDTVDSSPDGVMLSQDFGP